MIDTDRPMLASLHVYICIKMRLIWANRQNLMYSYKHACMYMLQDGLFIVNSGIILSFNIV